MECNVYHFIPPPLILTKINMDFASTEAPHQKNFLKKKVVPVLLPSRAHLLRDMRPPFKEGVGAKGIKCNDCAAQRPCERSSPRLLSIHVLCTPSQQWTRANALDKASPFLTRAGLAARSTKWLTE
jgi:hypothetical protein